MIILIESYGIFAETIPNRCNQGKSNGCTQRVFKLWLVPLHCGSYCLICCGRLLQSPVPEFAQCLKVLQTRANGLAICLRILGDHDSRFERLCQLLFATQTSFCCLCSSCIRVYAITNGEIQHSDRHVNDIKWH